MPIVLRRDGFRFFFFSNEGAPREAPHIHVRKADGEAKFWLETPALASSDGIDPRTLRELLRIVETERDLFLRAWHEHFG